MKKDIASKWEKIRFLDIENSSTEQLRINSTLEIEAKVFLGEISTDDVNVEIYFGKLNTKRELEDGRMVQMEVEEELGANKYLYRTSINNWDSGLNGYTLRIVPDREFLPEADRQKLNYWLNENT